MFIICQFPEPLIPLENQRATHFLRASTRWANAMDPAYQVVMTIGGNRVVLGQSHRIDRARRFADMAALRFKRIPKFNYSRKQAEFDSAWVPEAVDALDKVAAAHVIPDDPRDLLQRVKDLQHQVEALSENLGALQERLNTIEGL